LLFPDNFLLRLMTLTTPSEEWPYNWGLFAVWHVASPVLVSNIAPSQSQGYRALLFSECRWLQAVLKPLVHRMPSPFLQPPRLARSGRNHSAQVRHKLRVSNNSWTRLELINPAKWEGVGVRDGFHAVTNTHIGTTLFHSLLHQ
jgi:hypothetical protein